MSKLFSILKRLTRNDLSFLGHRLLMRSLYGNRIQQLANRDMFHRPEWFWGKQPMPAFRLEVPASTDGLPIDQKRALVKDLISSFTEAIKLDPAHTSYSSLWDLMIKRSAGDFVKALMNKDERKMLGLLERMFTHPALWGIGYGDFGLYQGRRFGSLVILHQLVGLAECLGVVRTECPEQGEIGHVFKEGAEAIVSAIERELGIRLDFPKIASAYGIRIGDRLLDMQTPGHLYAAFRFREVLRRYAPCDNPVILEIGAGFGGAAFWSHRLSPSSKYLILDLALTNVYQGWFLANALGRENVALFSDLLNGCQPGERIASIFPVYSQNRFKHVRFNGVFNQDSFPEMPRESVREYLRIARDQLDGILYSFNQEAFTPVGGEPPPWVSQEAAWVGGLIRISRELSWVRRGYVEEVFMPAIS